MAKLKLFPASGDPTKETCPGFHLAAVPEAHYISSVDQRPIGTEGDPVGSVC